jgi:hypothetical protein
MLPTRSKPGSVEADMASSMNLRTNDHVIGVITSGMASPRLPPVHR